MTQDDRIVVPINNIMKWLYCPMQVYIEYFTGREFNDINKQILKDGHEYHGVPISQLPDKLIDDILFGKLSKEDYNKKHHNKKQIKKFTKKELTDSKKGIDKLIKAKHSQRKTVSFFNTDELQRINVDSNFNVIDYEKYWGKNITVLSEKLKIIGSIDEIEKEDNKWLLIEKKSKITNNVYQDWVFQCNAYLYCLKELGLDIDRYKIVTPNNESYGTYDEKVVIRMEVIIEKIRNVIKNRKIPTHNLSSCNTCTNIKDCIIKPPKIDFHRKKIVMKKRIFTS